MPTERTEEMSDSSPQIVSHNQSTWASIATWRMAYEGMVKSSSGLEEGGQASDAVETLIQEVEANPDYTSVGYGALPNREGDMEMDAAFMDGNCMALGAVAGIQHVLHPISVARRLSRRHTSSFLVSQGATRYAQLNGFEMRNMLTDRARRRWELEAAKAARPESAGPYRGHDTVGTISLDMQGSMAAGTSTSGLFMKEPGRVGDSPLPGSGFYVDSAIGGAAATGLGEDIMKGCLSYRIVALMGSGLSPQEACDSAVYEFDDSLKNRYGKVGEISLIALSKRGEWGVATNVEFTFCTARKGEQIRILMANPDGKGGTRIEPVTKEWLQEYERSLKAPIK